MLLALLLLFLAAESASAEDSSFLPARATLNAPTIDGLADFSGGQWLDATAALLQFGSPGGTPIVVLAVSDDEKLYLAFIGDFKLDSLGDYLRVYFDQGAGGGSADGLLSGTATTRGEFGLGFFHDGSAITVREYSYNGDWLLNLGPAAAEGACGTLDDKSFCEVAVELAGGLSPNADRSYLNVSPIDHLGALFEYGSDGESYFASGTNGDSEHPGLSPGWTSMQLGLPAPVLSAVDAGGVVPVIDGGITGDGGWNNSARVPLILENETGDSITGEVNIKEDIAAAKIYLALRLPDQSGGQITFHFDEGSGSAGRDGALTAGNEDGFSVDDSGAVADLQYDGGWPADATADVEAATSVTDGDLLFELAFWRSSPSNEDLNLNVEAVANFSFEFLDELGDVWRPKVGRGLEYETDATTYLLGGLALATSAPFIQVISPADDLFLSGNVDLRVYASDDFGGADAITSAESTLVETGDYRPVAIIDYRRLADTAEWFSTWPSYSIADGTYYLRQQVLSPEIGCTYVSVRIDNLPPEIDDLVIDENPTAPGRTVQIYLTPNEPQAQTPVIEIFGNRAAFVSYLGGEWLFEYSVPSDWPAGNYPVTVTMIDEAGNYNKIAGYTSLEVDTEAPEMVGDLAVSPLIATVGDVIEIEFKLSERPVDEPAVTVDGNPAVLEIEDDLDYYYSYEVTGAENQAYVAVVVTAYDSLGRVGEFSFNDLYLDFNAPGFLDVNAVPSDIVPGTNIAITFESNEKLAEDPIVELAGKRATLFFSQELSYSYSYSVSRAVTPGRYWVSITGTDLAGNTGRNPEALQVEIFPESVTDLPPTLACEYPCDFLDDGICNHSCQPPEDEGDRLSGGVCGCSTRIDDTGRMPADAAAEIMLALLLAGAVFILKLKINKQP